MPLHKGSSIHDDRMQQQQHPLKRKQPLSMDESVASHKDDNVSLSRDLSKNRLIRSNDILRQSSLETLLDMLKAHAGIKDISEETQVHLNMVIIVIL